MKVFLKIAYWFVLCLALSVSVFADWVNLKEAIDRSMGKDTLFSQMAWLSDKQAIWYSIAYLIPFLILTFLLIYFAIKKKTKNALVISIAILLLFGISIYTDSLFYFSI